MTVPILSSLGGGGDSVASSGSAGADTQTLGGVAFEVLLGAAGAVPAERPAAVPEPSLELVLDGEWTLDPAPGAEPSDEPATGGDPLVGDSPGEELLVLEKDLSDWLAQWARGGRRIEGPSRKAPDSVAIEPVRLGIALETGAAAPAVPRAATVFGIDTDSEAVSTLWEDGAKPVSTDSADHREESEPVGPRAHRQVTDEAKGKGSDGEPPGSIDAEAASREFRAISRLIEVGGFVFPLGSEPVDTGLESSLDEAQTAHSSGGREPAAPFREARLGDAAARPAEVRSENRSAAMASEGLVRKSAAPRAGEVAASPDSAPQVVAPVVRRVTFERGSEARPLTKGSGEAMPAEGRVERPNAPPESGPRDGFRDSAARHRSSVEGEERREVNRAKDSSPPSESVSTAARPVGGAGHGVGVEALSHGPRPTADLASPRPAANPAAGEQRAAAPMLEPKVAPRPDRVVVDLADDLGDIGRLRLSVHGPSLRATIVPATREVAGQLDGGIRELSRSLAERGFTDARVSVQAPPSTETSAPAHGTGREVLVAARAAEAGGGSNPAADRGSGDSDRRSTDQQDHHERPGGQRRDRPQQERHQRGRNP